jgi:Putative prokaryotic signal transducing protein
VEKGDIVVFRKFENSIDANIVKTKLDAYGVPCFLTEENLSNLYPGQSFLFFHVRLHLFATDVERANQIMEESNLSINDDDKEPRI